MKKLTPSEHDMLQTSFDRAVKRGEFRQFYDDVAEVFGEDSADLSFRDRVSLALDDAERFTGSSDPDEEGGDMYPLLGDFLNSFRSYSMNRARADRRDPDLDRS